MNKIVAIYPGSFNKAHLGHKNILDKAIDIFGAENVLMAVGVNPAKEVDLTTINERINYIRSKVNCEVIYFRCFLHELIQEKEQDEYKVIIIKGLRNGEDLAYEDNQIKFIKDFKKDVRVIFLRCDPEFDHLSSSALRQLDAYRSGSGNKYLL